MNENVNRKLIMEVDILIHARVDLAQIGVESVEELSELLDESDYTTILIESSTHEDKQLELNHVSAEERL